MFLFFACSKDKEEETQFTLKTSDVLDDVDYQIYSTVLTGMQIDSKLPIIFQTSSKGMSISEETGTDSYIKFLKSEIPDLDLTVFTDYNRINTNAINFDNKFTVNSKTVKLVGEEELNFIFSVPDVNGGWERFYKKYPDSNGYTRFSRIGYNTDKTWAVLEIGNFYAGLGAEGSIIILKKENTAWKIVKILMTWIS
jgi:hypothetical protein